MLLTVGIAAGLFAIASCFAWFIAAKMEVPPPGLGGYSSRAPKAPQQQALLNKIAAGLGIIAGGLAIWAAFLGASSTP